MQATTMKQKNSIYAIMSYNILMKKVLVIFLSLFFLSFLPAQSNELMDKFLSRDFADTGTTLLLIAQAKGTLGSSDSRPEDALQWASSQKWGSRFSDSKADDVMTSGIFYLALLESLSVKGGLMYSLFKSPRLAVKEAVYQGIYKGIPYVNHPMTPLDVLTSLSIVMERQENGK